MVGRSRFRRAAVLVLVQRDRQILGGGQIAPLFDELAVLAKDENAKKRCAWLCIKLSGDDAIEIGHGENVLAGVSCDFQLVVTALKLFSFYVHAVSND